MAGDGDRRKFSDLLKIRTVQKIRDGSKIQAEADRLECSRTLIDKWVTDPRYQGNGQSNRQTPGQIPTKPVKATRAYIRKPKTSLTKAGALAPIATAHACPRCGQPLDLEGLN